MSATTLLGSLFISFVIVGVATSTSHGDIRPLDSTIRTILEKEIKRDSRLRNADVNVRAIAGNVYIEGKVESVLDRMRLQEVSKRIDGVRNISVRVKVEPVPLSDRGLVRSIQNRLKADAFLRATGIRVDVKHRRALITGAVSSVTQKYHVDRVVRETRGVMTVDNQLKVELLESDGTRRDEAIQSDVEQALQKHNELYLLPIDAYTEDGTVVLSGAVETPHQRRLAQQSIQSIVGVREVVIEIEVAPIVESRRYQQQDVTTWR